MALVFPHSFVCSAPRHLLLIKDMVPGGTIAEIPIAMAGVTRLLGSGHTNQGLDNGLCIH